MKNTESKSYKNPITKLKWLGPNSNMKLNYLAGINRPIYPAQVTKLAESLEEMGVVRPVIIATISFITGKNTSYIIDGQHLFNALIRMGWDIPYVSIEIKDKKELVEKIALLNSSSKSWALVDYITAWSSLVPDYVKLNHYYQVYDIDMSVVASVLSNNISDSGSMTRRIKRGEFKIINEEHNVTILNCLTDVLKIIPRMNRMENRYMCREYIKFLRHTKGYNHAKFLSNLEKNKKQFVLATQENGKLYEMFDKLKK